MRPTRPHPFADRWHLFAFVLIASVVWLGQRHTYHDYGDVDRYDPYFKRYSTRYFGDEMDWRYFKAQAIAESRLRKKAHSHDGAMGIMQILPETFSYIRSKNQSIPDDPWNPRWNIAAAIYYDRLLWDTWAAERPPKERLQFMFGSYNAGPQAILQAQEIALQAGLKATRWEAIESTLSQVSGDAARETIQYVADIFVIYDALPPKQDPGTVDGITDEATQ